MDKDADNAGKGVNGCGFLYREKGELPCPARLPQSGGGVMGVQIAGLGKNNGNNIILRKMVFFQQGIVEQGNLPANIFRRVYTLSCPAQGIQTVHAHPLPPAAAIIIELSMAKPAPIIPVKK